MEDHDTKVKLQKVWKRIYQYYQSSSIEELACFSVENLKYFHTDKIANLIFPLKFEQVLQKRIPFISFRAFLMNKEGKIYLPTTPNEDTIGCFSQVGIIPYTVQISYEHIEESIHEAIAKHSPFRIDQGSFIGLKYHESSEVQEMIYFYLGVVSFQENFLHDNILDGYTPLSETQIKFLFKSDKCIPHEEASLIPRSLFNFNFKEFGDLMTSSKNPFSELHPRHQGIFSAQTPSNITYESVGAIIGRFQPFHRGHAQLILEMLKKHHWIKIGIGSSQYHHTATNPFTYEHRREMITIFLQSHQIPSTNYQIYPIPDLHDYIKWGDSVLNILGKFDLFYSNSSWTRQIMNERGKLCAPVLKFDFTRYNGSKIREKIRMQQFFEEELPPEVANYISNLDLQSYMKP